MCAPSSALRSDDGRQRVGQLAHVQELLTNGTLTRTAVLLLVREGRHPSTVEAAGASLKLSAVDGLQLCPAR